MRIKAIIVQEDLEYVLIEKNVSQIGKNERIKSIIYIYVYIYVCFDTHVGIPGGIPIMSS